MPPSCRAGEWSNISSLILPGGLGLLIVRHVSDVSVLGELWHVSAVLAHNRPGCAPGLGPGLVDRSPRRDATICGGVATGFSVSSASRLLYLYQLETYKLLSTRI